MDHFTNFLEIENTENTQNYLTAPADCHCLVQRRQTSINSEMKLLVQTDFVAVLQQTFLKSLYRGMIHREYNSLINIPAAVSTYLQS